MKIIVFRGGQAVVKIKHYRLKIDSLKHPAVPRQETAQYKLDAD